MIVVLKFSLGQLIFDLLVRNNVRQHNATSTSADLIVQNYPDVFDIAASFSNRQERDLSRALAQRVFLHVSNIVPINLIRRCFDDD